MENYYKLLNVPEAAEEQEIKKAYKKLAVKFHPDKNPNNAVAEERFKQINEAYQTLSNKELRATYDYLLLNLRYQTLSQQHTQTHTQPSNYREPGYTPSTPSYRDEDQKKGVTWALGILGIVAVLVISALSVISFLHYLDKQELTERRNVFRERLQNNLSADSTRMLMLEILAEIEEVGFNEELLKFKAEILEEVHKKANANFQEKSYQTAIGFYHVWKEFKPLDLEFLNTRISLCYKFLGNKVLAKKMFEEMIGEGSNTIFAHFELAKLEETQFQDLENAFTIMKKQVRK
jgi:curved DNA-binding protein CbpA